MQLELWVEPSSAGPGRTAVGKIMLMLYTENTPNGGQLFSHLLQTMRCCWKLPPKPLSERNIWSVFILLFTTTRHMVHVWRVYRSEFVCDVNVCLSVVLQNGVTLRLSAVLFIKGWAVLQGLGSLHLGAGLMNL